MNTAEDAVILERRFLDRWRDDELQLAQIHALNERREGDNAILDRGKRR